MPLGLGGNPAYNGSAAGAYGTGTVPGAGQIGYYDPLSWYGGTRYAPGQFATSPLGSFYLEDQSNRDAALQRFLMEQGYNPSTGIGRYATGRLNQLDAGYRAAAATNPELSFRNYLGTVNLQGLYQQQTPTQRGENPWLYAPRARTIARGF